MNKKSYIKKLTVQLSLVATLIFYLLNLFQNDFFIFCHNISHQFTTIQILDEGHNFLNSQNHSHKHFHSHSHKSLSIFKLILDNNSTKQPVTKNKKEIKIDKHIVNHFNLKPTILSSFITHSYIFTNNIIKSPELKASVPPPKYIFS